MLPFNGQMNIFQHITFVFLINILGGKKISCYSFLEGFSPKIISAFPYDVYVIWGWLWIILSHWENHSCMFLLMLFMLPLQCDPEVELVASPVQFLLAWVNEYLFAMLPPSLEEVKFMCKEKGPPFQSALNTRYRASHCYTAYVKSTKTPILMSPAHIADRTVKNKAVAALCH